MSDASHRARAAAWPTRRRRAVRRRHRLRALLRRRRTRPPSTRLFALKGRPRAQARRARVLRARRRRSPRCPSSARARARRSRALLPGPLTLLVPNPAGRFPLARRRACSACACSTSGIALGAPVLQSSANLAGGPDARTLDEVPAEIRAGADLELDRGELPGTPSTVVDLSAFEAAGALANRARGSVHARGDRARAGRLAAVSRRAPARLLLPPARRGRPRDRRGARARAGAPAEHARADRVGELRAPRGARGAGQRAHEQVRGGLSRAPATTAAASTSTSPSSSRSTAPRSCSAPSTPTSSRTPARRPTPSVYHALLEPGDTIMGLSLAHGGHLTHGMKKNVSGRLYEIVPYEVDRETSLIDMDAVARARARAPPEAAARRLVGLSAPARLRPLPRDRRRGRRAADGRHGALRRPRRGGPAPQPGRPRRRRRHDDDAQDARAGRAAG